MKLNGVIIDKNMISWYPIKSLIVWHIFSDSSSDVPSQGEVLEVAVGSGRNFLWPISRSQMSVPMVIAQW